MSTEPELSHGSLLDNLSRLVGKAIAVLRNRAELFAVELQEEEYRLIDVLLLAGSALLLGLLAIMLFTAVIIFVFGARYRLYVAAGLGGLYLCAAGCLLLRLKARLKAEPFAETINQIRKDAECLRPPNEPG